MWFLSTISSPHNIAPTIEDSRTIETDIGEAQFWGGDMRSLLLTILVVLVSALSVGCSADRSPPDFQAQLDAALAINGPQARDNALATVAENAAAAAEVDIAKKAVAKISHPVKKDKAAEGAALKLARAGKSAAAVEVAKMINDVTLRDNTLSKLTK
jgi:hypothetical protein